jgi:hypothetical protein
MKKIVSLFVFLSAICLSVNAQNDVGNAIDRFKNTDFMLKYNDFKWQIEGEVEDFIATQNNYTPKDIRRVRNAYDKTVMRFNQVMLDIKQDFLMKEKVKMINKFPQMYSDGLKSKMQELEQVYKENLQLAFTEAGENGGSALLALLVGLIQSSSELSGYFKSMKYEKTAMTEAYIQKNLIEPSKFKTWEELTAGATIQPKKNKEPEKDKDIEQEDKGNEGNKQNEGDNKDTNNKNTENIENQTNTEGTTTDRAQKENSGKISVEEASKIKKKEPLKAATPKKEETKKGKN